MSSAHDAATAVPLLCHCWTATLTIARRSVQLINRARAANNAKELRGEWWQGDPLGKMFTILTDTDISACPVFLPEL